MPRLPVALAPLLVVLLGCTDRLGPPAVAGTYVLESVNGVPVPLPGLYAQTGGSITLTSTGVAERRISYTIDAQGTQREEVAAGTFELVGDSVLRLSLHVDGVVWTPDASLAAGAIRLRLPSPVDGPDMVELYRHH